MSNRDSLGRGDLIPQDVVDILAQEKHNRRSRKKRSNSLGRALGWLKGKKRRDRSLKGESNGGSPEIFMSVDAHPAGHHGGHKGGQRSGRQAPPQAVRKLEDERSPTPPLLQENVFIESSRPKYLENLHSEALEGLKMMQQEESNNGVDCKDNESTVSTMTVHTDGEGGGFVTDSTIGDTTSVVSVQSSVSSRSSRSGLTRQGSTFRPLNPEKKPEKGKTRRRQRKTIGGIPQHVQREMGLDRGGWAVSLRVDEEEAHNGETDDGSVPDGPQTTAGSQKHADGSSQQTKTVLPLNRDQIEQLAAAHAGHRDDIALLRSLVPDLSGERRPQSLAVPWMTTANSLLQKPPSPVMSMSPQAAYMSKIIPNAVLPPSIDVVEISRGRSRNSVRTVSHGSLLVSSPATSRSSSRACSSRASTANTQNMSDSSCWSNSGSTETLVSDSSTVSSSTTPQQMGSQDGDRNTVLSSSSRASHTSNGGIAITRKEAKKEGPFARSLSVMKPKKAPPPPSRSYSLHTKMKRRSRDLTGIGSAEPPRHIVLIEEKTENKSSPPSSRVIDSPGYNADTSSLEDSTGSVSFSPMRTQLQAEKAAKADGTGSKDSSPGKQEQSQNKVVSPSSGYSSQDGSSKAKHGSSAKHKSGILAKLQKLFPGSSSAVSTTTPLPRPGASEGAKPEISVDAGSVSPSVRALIELFNIPPPPKVHAPPPPPPEVWAHSKRSFELLLGPPAPDNLSAIIRKNPKDRRQRKSSSLTESAVKSLMGDRKHKIPAVESANGSLKAPETTKGQESVISNESPEERKVDLTGSESATEIDGKVRVSSVLNGMLVKAVERREERLAAGRKQEGKREATQAAEDQPPAISLVHISLPPPIVQPPPPTTVLAPVAKEPMSPELSWPPPPPPVGVSGPEDFELPLPPPPVFLDGVLLVPADVPAEKSHPGGGSSCTSSLSVVESECGRMTAEAEPQKPSKSRGNSPLPLNIPPPPSYTAPPPPSYTAPPPPVKMVYPPHLKNVSDLQEGSPPLPQNGTPPPLLIKTVTPPPPKVVTPTPPPPTGVAPLPTLREVVTPSPPPPKVITPTPPPPTVVVPLPPPIEVVSPPPPPKSVTPTPPPPKAVTPPPPPKSVTPTPPPPKSVTPTPPPPKSVTPTPPPPKSVAPTPPPPKAVTPPPPPKELIPPPPPATEVVLPPPTTEDSPPPHKDVSPPLPVKGVTPPPLAEVSCVPPQTEEPASLPAVDVSLVPLEEVAPVETSSPVTGENATSTQTSLTSSPADKEVSPTRALLVSSTEAVLPSAEESGFKGEAPEYTAPPSVPPTEPSQLQSSGDIVVPPAGATSHCEANHVSFKSILTPPQSIPPPPPIELHHQPEDAVTDGPASQEFSIPPENSKQPSPESSPLKATAPSAPVDVPSPSPLPVQDPSDMNQEPSPTSTEEQTPQLPPAAVIQEEPAPSASPSPAGVPVAVPSVNGSSEAPQEQEQPDTGVTMRNKIPASSSNAEAPQKPIRKSLIINLPSPTSPPAVVTPQAPPPNPEPPAAPPASSSSVPSLTVRSPPGASVSPSMNLQEAIRLRTAARSMGGPSARLSLSPTSPRDPRRSPSSAASFVFAKSSKKVVIETKPVAETKAGAQKSRDVSSPAKVDGETEPAQKGAKVPPPVARKPKTKGREMEASEGTEATAGQEEEQESSMDDGEKSNGTAGTVEEVMPST